MSRVLRFASAALVAVAVEAAIVVVLVHVVGVNGSVALVFVFAAACVALFATLGVLRLSGRSPPLRSELSAHVVVGLALLMVVEATFYLCDDQLHLGLVMTNGVVLVSVACWAALGWRFSAVVLLRAADTGGNPWSRHGRSAPTMVRPVSPLRTANALTPRCR